VRRQRGDLGRERLGPGPHLRFVDEKIHQPPRVGLARVDGAREQEQLPRPRFAADRGEAREAAQRILPSRAGGRPSFTPACATRRSQVAASSQPPPIAGPFSAATMGTGEAATARIKPSNAAAAAARSPSASRSKPPENARPAGSPTSTAARTPLVGHALIRSPISAHIRESSAFRFAGFEISMTSIIGRK
jgi:hypothetical protein